MKALDRAIAEMEEARESHVAWVEYWQEERTQALTLHQPWATLVAIGAKQVDAHWGTDYTGRLVIHSAKRMPKEAKDFTMTDVCQDALFAAYKREVKPGSLPIGRILAVCTLDRCAEMTEESIKALREQKPTEYAFGAYEPGRVAWVLKDVQQLPEPMRALGQQQLWQIDPAIDAEIRRQLEMSAAVEGPMTLLDPLHEGDPLDMDDARKASRTLAKYRRQAEDDQRAQTERTVDAELRYREKLSIAMIELRDDGRPAGMVRDLARGKNKEVRDAYRNWQLEQGKSDAIAERLRGFEGERAMLRQLMEWSSRINLQEREWEHAQKVRD